MRRQEIRARRQGAPHTQRTSFRVLHRFTEHRSEPWEVLYDGFDESRAWLEFESLEMELGAGIARIMRGGKTLKTSARSRSRTIRDQRRGSTGT
jgi:hypothetical protein